MPDVAVAAPPSAPANRLQRPRWRDTRLLLGVLLVMTSVVVGSRAVAAADRTEAVWTLAHDLAAGSTLEGEDLLPRAVRLGSVGANYVRVGDADPVGSTLVRGVAAGDLLPVAALQGPGAAASSQQRQVTVPVGTFHYPNDLARGRLVDVYVTPGGDTGSAVGVPELLVPRALVVSVEDAGTRFGGTGASIGVVLAVPAADVAALVAGLHRGPVDLIRVAGE